MDLITRGQVLALQPRKDRGELYLGAALAVFGLCFLCAAPLAATQQWSYRFGAVTPAGKLFGAACAALMALVCLAGAFHAIVVKIVYRFDLRTGTFFTAGYYFTVRQGLSRPLTDIAGLVLTAGAAGPGSVRFWIGVQFTSGERQIFEGCFESRQAAEKLLVAISSFSGLAILPEKR